MKMFSWSTFLVIAVSVFGACKLAETEADVSGRKNKKPGIDAQNTGGNCNNGSQKDGSQNGGSDCNRPGADSQNGGAVLPFDPDWEMANWRIALCRCAGHERDPDARKANYIKGLCYTEVNEKYDNRFICAKKCTEIMDKAGGANAKGCPNASDPYDNTGGKLPPTGGGGKVPPTDPNLPNDPAYGGGTKPPAPVPPAGPVTKPGGEVQK
jgi:hypothetical protein